MAYLGNVPARSFISFERQVFTIVNSQTAYTLSHSVTNENDIRLVVNNIVQEPGSGKAYTASGTTLTLSAALVNGTDEMYCVFLGRAVGTVNAPAGSVSTSQLVDLNVTTGKIAADAITEAKIADDAVESEHLNNNVISGQTELATAPADTDEFLVSDAGTLKRIDYSHIKGTSDFVKVASTTLSSGTASVSLTGMDSTYKHFKIIASDVTLDTSENLYFRFINSGGDITGSSYFGIGDGAYKPYNSSDAVLRYSNYNSAYGRVSNFDMSTNATNASGFEMYILNPSNSATYPLVYGNVGNSGSNGSYMITNTFAFQYTSAGAVTGIKFYTPSGNDIDTGTFALYGLKG
jgi:hypothetical protein